jgi:RimJ/RimL family protein N-acetyltransferase
MTSQVSIRPVLDGDLPIFYKHQSDPEADRMAAFSKQETDWETFRARWMRMLADPTSAMRTIVVDGQVAGNVLKFVMFEQPSVAYWLGKEFWGRGIATAALRLLLQEETERPLYARAAKDNFGSVRVLEKCGFKIVGEETNMAAARGEPTREVIMELK